MACAVEGSGFEIRDMAHRLSKDTVLKLVRELFCIGNKIVILKGGLIWKKKFYR